MATSTPQISTLTAFPVGDDTSNQEPVRATVPDTLDLNDEETFTVPTVDGTDEDSDDDDDDFANVELFKPECLKCSHLVAFEKKAYKGCHFTKGNEHCPAQALRIVIRIPVEDIVRRFLTAERTNDNITLSKLYQKLSEKPDWYQARVNEALAEARASSKL